MFGRVSTYELPQGRATEAVQSFHEAIASIEELPGLRDAYLLLSEDDSQALTVTLWETHDAMAASRVRATRVRSEAAAAVGSNILSTVEYRVAIHSIGAEAVA